MLLVIYITGVKNNNEVTYFENNVPKSNKTVYTSNEEKDTGENEKDKVYKNYEANKEKYGIEAWETSGHINESKSWNYDTNGFCICSMPFAGRGGNFEYGVKSGIFCCNRATGSAWIYSTFRPVLWKQ